ncbi:signal peptidase I [Microbacterium sp. zg.Y625]|uniref:signal peptidase I n=1 Tax=Microbacterium jiangjiandongii TaxID=3049071 RepID=UPI00214ABADC|nr:MULTISPECIES: signal peptidase I [unclassified Microbacterium]MCR2793301.1 signal peptidase I [Microbacterium sp. zg.Y625]WIM25323.1 signal peptidase I [Microbacterium sp. zg-Y625]
MTVTAPSPLPAELDSRRTYRAAQTRDRSLLQQVGVSLSASLLILLLGIAVAVVGLPAVVGGTAMTVLTQSMEPRLPPGSLVVIKPTPVDDIAVGDVITYQIRSGEAAVVSHRVVSKTYADGELTFITKGDNNAAVDPEPVQAVQIRGTLWYSLPLLGWVNNALRGSDRTVVLAVAAGGLFLYAAGSVGSVVREKRRARTADAAAAI